MSLARPSTVAALLVVLGSSPACSSPSRTDSAPATGAAPAQLALTLAQQVAAAPRFKVPVTISQPSRGPSDALVTVVEWADLRSFPAKHAASVMDELLAAHPAELRLTHRHQIVESMPDSMLLHSFARAAHTVGGKFWEARAKLFAFPEDKHLVPEDLEAIANEVGVSWKDIKSGVEEGMYARHVAADGRFAKNFGVTEPPTFFVNGKRVPSVPPGELRTTLQAFIDAELSHARSVVSSGTPAAEVYDAIVEDGLWSTTDDPEKRKAAKLMSAPPAVAPKAL
jgi:protein-disulfide isomerase